MLPKYMSISIKCLLFLYIALDVAVHNKKHSHNHNIVRRGHTHLTSMKESVARHSAITMNQPQS